MNQLPGTIISVYLIYLVLMMESRKKNSNKNKMLLFRFIMGTIIALQLYEIIKIFIR